MNRKEMAILCRGEALSLREKQGDLNRLSPDTYEGIAKELDNDRWEKLKTRIQEIIDDDSKYGFTSDDNISYYNGQTSAYEWVIEYMEELENEK